MTIEKLPSGNYRLSEMVDGKRYRKTIDHKPSDREAKLIMADIISKRDVISSDMPFDSACRAYIKSRSNVLSPSSLRRYNQYLNNITDSLAKARLNVITKPMIQEDINSFSEKHAPKTVSNYYGFISAVLNFYGKEIKGIVLPQKEKKSPAVESGNGKQIHNTQIG